MLCLIREHINHHTNQPVHTYSAPHYFLCLQFLLIIKALNKRMHKKGWLAPIHFKSYNTVLLKWTNWFVVWLNGSLLNELYLYTVPDKQQSGPEHQQLTEVSPTVPICTFLKVYKIWHITRTLILLVMKYIKYNYTSNFSP